MRKLPHLLTYLVIITLVVAQNQQQQFEHSRFLSENVLSERQTKSAIICVGHCLQNSECSAVRFTRSCRHCQLFSDVLWLYGSEIPPLDSDVVEYKMVCIFKETSKRLFKESVQLIMRPFDSGSRLCFGQWQTLQYLIKSLLSHCLTTNSTIDSNWLRKLVHPFKDIWYKKEEPALDEFDGVSC